MSYTETNPTDLSFMYSMKYNNVAKTNMKYGFNFVAHFHLFYPPLVSC